MCFTWAVWHQGLYTAQQYPFPSVVLWWAVWLSGTWSQQCLLPPSPASASSEPLWSIRNATLTTANLSCKATDITKCREKVYGQTFWIHNSKKKAKENCCNLRHDHMRPLFLQFIPYTTPHQTTIWFSFPLTNSSSILELDFQHLHRSCDNNLRQNKMKVSGDSAEICAVWTNQLSVIVNVKEFESHSLGRISIECVRQNQCPV